MKNALRNSTDEKNGIFGGQKTIEDESSDDDDMGMVKKVGRSVAADKRRQEQATILVFKEEQRQIDLIKSYRKS